MLNFKIEAGYDFFEGGGGVFSKKVENVDDFF